MTFFGGLSRRALFFTASRPPAPPPQYIRRSWRSRATVHVGALLCPLTCHRQSFRVLHQKARVRPARPGGLIATGVLWAQQGPAIPRRDGGIIGWNNCTQDAGGFAHRPSPDRGRDPTVPVQISEAPSAGAPAKFVDMGDKPTLKCSFSIASDHLGERPIGQPLRTAERPRAPNFGPGRSAGGRAGRWSGRPPRPAAISRWVKRPGALHASVRSS